MEFVVNECSLHGQFPTVDRFRDALKRLLDIRARIVRERRVLRCHRNLAGAAVSPGFDFRRAVGQMERDLQRVVMSWLQKEGPFWDDEGVRVHDPGDWFEVSQQLVTDTGIAEAAKLSAQKGLCSLVSFDPSGWTHTPVQVDWIQSNTDRLRIDVDNHWTLDTVGACLEKVRPALSSWDELANWAREECQNLILARDVVRPFDGRPFVPAAAERFQALLGVLNKLKSDVDKLGSFGDEGNRLRQDFFERKNALFTDSSDSEKSEFKKLLTFPHPESPGETLFCTWHGKVRGTEPMRMHFTFPIRKEEPLYVVYIGPKITKR